LCSGIIPFGLYIGALYVPYPSKIALLVLVNVVEQPLAIFQASPFGERLLAPSGFKRTVNIDRYIERYEGFFIIILGEGVFRLIEGSPSGMGITKRSGTVVTTLMLYYVLHWLYFNGDQSKQFVHALRRTWWKPILWQL
jgi:low temperature requirement protein LtrA